jgi:BirA family biotin operon repressor/biotin-[acetyl-CoA-carboxylase] ligase
MHFDRFAPGVIDRLRGATFIAAGEHHEQIGSTSDRASQLLADGLEPAPYLVLAERQTAGRGRGANVWFSAPGGLTFTLIVDPAALHLARARLGLVSLATALAVERAMRSLHASIAPRLKWPNDVYLKGRKLAGVLVEVPPTRPARLIIGVGVNVNNSFAGFPPDVREKAIALADAAGAFTGLEELLRETIAALEAKLEELAADSRPIISAFRERCLLTGRDVALETAAGRASGFCLGIDDDGALRLESAGKEERFFAGVVTAFRPGADL